MYMTKYSWLASHAQHEDGTCLHSLDALFMVCHHASLPSPLLMLHQVKVMSV